MEQLKQGWLYYKKLLIQIYKFNYLRFICLVSGFFLLVFLVFITVVSFYYSNYLNFFPETSFYKQYDYQRFEQFISEMASFTGDLSKEQIQIYAKLFSTNIVVSIFYFLTFFTYQTNYIFLVCLLCVGLFWDKPVLKRILFYSACWITVTFLIYWLVIFWSNNIVLNHPVYVFQTTWLHLVNPVVAWIILWYLKKEITLKKNWYYAVVSYPICYFFALFAIYFMGYLINFQFQKNLTTNTVVILKKYDIKYPINDFSVYNAFDFFYPLYYGKKWGSGDNKFIILGLNFFVFFNSILIPFFIGKIFIRVFQVATSLKTNLQKLQTNNL